MAVVVAAAVLPLGPSPAQATESEVGATMDAQSYTVTSPYGSPTVRRRRFTQTLSLGIYDLQGLPQPDGPCLSWVSRMRLDTDLGQQPAERDPGRLDRFVPGLQEMPLDLMVAYLEAADLVNGWVGFRLGRQPLIDALGWWSFDGGLLRISTPAWVRVEVYGGFEQRGGSLALSTSRFTADGVYRGNRDDLEAHQWASYLEESKAAPAVGFAVETLDLHWVHARLGYRRVSNRDRVSVTPFADPESEIDTVNGWRVSSERGGGALWLTAPELGQVEARGVYDLYNQVLSEHAASVAWFANRAVTLTLEYDYYLPTFDGDSIFNWFSHQGMTTYRGRGAWQVSRKLDLSASSGVRQFRAESGADGTQALLPAGQAPGAGRRQQRIVADALGAVGGTYRWAAGSVGLNGMGEAGQSGHRLGADLTTRQQFAGGRYDSLVVLSLYDWRNETRTGRDATSFGYVLGGGVLPLQNTRLGIEWEHSINRLVGQRFRLLASLRWVLLQ